MNSPEPGTTGLVFTPVTPGDYDRILPFTSAYGEGSCQLSPVSMFSQAEKYGDAVCFLDGAMYTLRENLCGGGFRVYLAPLGKGAAGYAAVLSDARAHGQRVKFESLTEAQAVRLEEAFPGRFEITEDRDLAEYMYRTEVMAAFPGRKQRKRRRSRPRKRTRIRRSIILSLRICSAGARNP